MKELVLVIFLFLSSMPEGVAAEADTEEFEFSETIAIYDLVENGGIIYARPDRYDENQGFIKVYESLEQYLAELSGPVDATLFPPENQPLTGEFMLVTRDSQKRCLLKEGWLGDGEHWVPMHARDYNILWSVVDARRDLSGAVTGDEELKAYTAAVRDSVGSDNVSDSVIRRGQRQEVGGQVLAGGEKTSESSSAEPVSDDRSSSSGPANKEIRVEGDAQPFEGRPVSANSTNTTGLGFRGGSLSVNQSATRDASPTPREAIQERSHARSWRWVLLSIAIFALSLYLYKKR